jgi:hypothetical protein
MSSRSLPNFCLYTLLPIAFISFFIVFYFDGTGAEADSVSHYQFARYAFEHPQLFLDHWAKPVYTILASPFAQFGFTGVKVFNVLCSLGSMLFSYLICRELGLKYNSLVAWLYFMFPLSFQTTFSGFTEPLCAVTLTVAIYLCLRKKYLPAAILISFTPFIRSEGLLFVGCFAIYFMILRHYISLLSLLTGHLFFALLGYLAFDYGFAWVFTKIPYSNLSSPYGSGELLHFTEKLLYIMGIPATILFGAGILSGIFHFPKTKKEFNILILFTFLCFFVTHTLFWYLGIFNSMGLKRVFAAVTPLMAITCLYGFNFAAEMIKIKKYRRAFQATFLIYLFVFPFTSNPAAVEWEKDLMLTPPQQMAQKIGEYLEKHNLQNRRLIFSDNYLAEVTGIDPFSKNRLFLYPEGLKELKTGDVVIWENWHAPFDFQVSLQMLKEHPSLQAITMMEDHTHSRPVIYALFLRKKEE